MTLPTPHIDHVLFTFTIHRRCELKRNVVTNEFQNSSTEGSRAFVLLPDAKPGSSLHSLPSFQHCCAVQVEVRLNFEMRSQKFPVRCDGPVFSSFHTVPRWSAMGAEVLPFIQGQRPGFNSNPSLRCIRCFAFRFPPPIRLRLAQSLAALAPVLMFRRSSFFLADMWLLPRGRGMPFVLVQAPGVSQ